jgi:hypothetical protein
MRKRLQAAYKALRGNSGSGIVLVLVCMLCVSMLGIMILYLSYTGMLLKMTQRQAQNDFYTATTAMDEVRTGIQKAVSDSVARAYKTVLINYSNTDFDADQKDMTAKFQHEYIEALKAWKISDESVSSPGLIDTTGGKYKIEVLKTFVDPDKLKDGEKTTGVVVSASGGNNNIVLSDKSITLKNVTVSYTDSKNYTSIVTSDIVIGMPDFSYMISNYSIAGINSFAILAKDGLTNSGPGTVIGNVYAGKIWASNNTLTLNSGTIVCPDTLSASGAGSKLTTSNATVWANRAVAGAHGDSNGEISFDGTEYIKDDLELAGYQSSVTLKGSYFGYGNSTVKADESSSIIVNGRGSTLTASGLSTLMLAGHSFINNETIDSDVLMGESVSARGNQMAYLIPPEYLSDTNGKSPDTNPVVHTTDSDPGISINGSGHAALDKYGVTTQPINFPYPGSSQTATYYFMKFGAADGRTAEQKANEFFKDYFAANTTKVQKYLDGYLSAYNLPSASRSAGWTITKTNGKYALGFVPVESTKFTNSAQMSDTFSCLCETLSSKHSVGDTPYTYYVDTGKVGKIVNGTNYFRDSNNKIVGVVANTGFTINGKENNSNLNFIIATGDVNVSRNFTGLIISGGKVTIGDGVKVTADSTVVSNALNAVAYTTMGGVSYKLSDFLKIGGGESQTVGESDSGWDMNALVTYQNWSKS